MLTGDPSSKVWVAPPGREPMPPVAGSKQLTHWTSEPVWWCENAGAPQTYTTEEKISLVSQILSFCLWYRNVHGYQHEKLSLEFSNKNLGVSKLYRRCFNYKNVFNAHKCCTWSKEIGESPKKFRFVEVSRYRYLERRSIEPPINLCTAAMYFLACWSSERAKYINW